MVISAEKNLDLWAYLRSEARTGRPIVMYGMGNGADKILSVLEANGIAAADFFASDGFVRGHAFHGKTVLSYSAMREKYAEASPIVLIAFASSRPDVLALMERVAAECETYIPDVPVCGTELFDAAFVKAHQDEITAARALFADDASQRIFDGIVSYKVSGRMDVLRATESDPAEAYSTILHADRFETIADLGAYNGDSIRDLRCYAPALSHVIAMEPDRRNFRKLDAYAASLRESEDRLQVFPIPAGAWSEDTTLTFHGSGNRNAGLTDRPAAPSAYPSQSPLRSTAENPYFGKSESVPVRALDRVMDDLRTSGTLSPTVRMDYIKYDVEGAEREAILGSRRIIEKEAPALLVSVYHRSSDLFSLPLLLHELNPRYRLYLRRMAGVPAWDINLYAVP